jgi:mutual gliding-motility protein MglA
MALFNYATKEITIKIVYYGPGLSGKTTNLQYLHSKFDPLKRGKLLSLATEADRTLFFDFLPVEIGKISDFSIRFQLYTVPGQVRYNATRKLVLKGADAVIFVADSQREMKEQNIESLINMRENLISNNINPDDIPVFYQFNKRDLSNILSIEELNRDLNPDGKFAYLDAVAINGIGVEESFQRITKIVIKNILQKHKVKIRTSDEIAEPPTPSEKPSEETVSSKTDFEPPEPSTPVFETSNYESSQMPIERSQYDIPKAIKQPVQQVLHDAVYETPAFPEEPPLKQAPIIPLEKLEAIINGLTEMTQAVKNMKNVLSGVHSEISDVKKEQKEIRSHLRSITDNIENLKEKKSWFRFF